MNNPPGGQLDHEKEIEQTKPKVNDGHEVACPHVLGVIFREERPGLRGGFGRADAGDIALNGVFGDDKAEFERFPVFRSASVAVFQNLKQ